MLVLYVVCFMFMLSVIFWFSVYGSAECKSLYPSWVLENVYTAFRKTNQLMILLEANELGCNLTTLTSGYCLSNSPTPQPSPCLCGFSSMISGFLPPRKNKPLGKLSSQLPQGMNECVIVYVHGVLGRVDVPVPFFIRKTEQDKTPPEDE